ncbi:hypothetical protein OC834_007222 [Tilletia horrida]|nr:hypothetical protein OC834_007222 [Tilletia horrida]
MPNDHLHENVYEIPEGEFDVPSGYYGNLDEDQLNKLRELWAGFFDVLGRAKGSGAGGGGNLTAEFESDPTKSNIPKGDAAKDAKKAEDERKAMNDLIEEYGADVVRDACWRFTAADAPDTGMLRFLRARKWDVGRALAMLAATLKWRLDTKVDAIAEAGDEGNQKIEKFLDQQSSGKVYAMANSKTLQPIVYIHVKKHFTRGQPGESMQKFILSSLETDRLLMVPPNDKVILIFDMKGFGISNMDFGSILFVLKCLEAYYPESLGFLAIHRAPFIFQGFWAILRPLLDPVVRAKVGFTNKPKDLEDRIPADRLVPIIDGEMLNEFNFIPPEAGENKLHQDEEGRKREKGKYMDLAQQFEDVTREWIKLGQNSQALLEKRMLLSKKLRVQQYAMEPYFRGKSVLHRDGTIDGTARVTWYYKQKDGRTQKHVLGRKYCVATLKREIKEIEDGVPLKEAEARTDKALADKDWVALYGSAEIAREYEGRLRGVAGDPVEKEEKKEEEEAPAAAAHAPAAPTDPAPANGAAAETFHEAPKASARQVREADGEATTLDKIKNKVQDVIPGA